MLDCDVLVRARFDLRQQQNCPRTHCVVPSSTVFDHVAAVLHLVVVQVAMFWGCDAFRVLTGASHKSLPIYAGRVLG
jgi:hypothetical protein